MRLSATRPGTLSSPRMSKDAQRPGTAGFALIEVMVSLLLLAVALLGAAAALIEALAAQQAALVQTRAADLAGDLSETLRAGLPPSETDIQVAAWRDAVATQLPGATAVLEPTALGEDSAALPASFHILLQWHEPRSNRDVSLALPTHPLARPAS